MRACPILHGRFPHARTDDGCECPLVVDELRVERDNARAIARVLAHSYTHDSRPPQRMVDEALAFPARPASEHKED